MAKTERARYSFTVKECSDGTPWIMLEPVKEDITSLKNGFLGFDLPRGTDMNRAQKVAEYLNGNIASLSHTSS